MTTWAVIDDGYDDGRVSIIALPSPYDYDSIPDGARVVVGGLMDEYLADRVRDRINATRDRRRVQDRVEMGLSPYADPYADEDMNGDDDPDEDTDKGGV